MPTEPKYFKKKGVIACLLWPLSLLWQASIWIREKLASPPYKSRVPVICVGNLVVGGSGKTPIVITLAEHFINDGLKVGIVSRGYGRKNHQPQLALASSNATDVGDEPLEMATRLPKAIIAVAASRATAAKMVEKKVDLIIMDDGLQHYSLYKDFKIAVFGSQAGYGNGFTLPAGPLREPLSRLKSIDAVVITGPENPALARELSKYGKPVFTAPGKLDKVKKGLKAVAFAGIGNPEKFFNALNAAGVNLLHTKGFPDHHNYTRTELETLLTPGLPVLTTHKDFVKIPTDLKPYFTPVGMTSQLDTSMFSLLRSTIISRGI